MFQIIGYLKGFPVIIAKGINMYLIIYSIKVPANSGVY